MLHSIRAKKRPEPSEQFVRCNMNRRGKAISHTIDEWRELGFFYDLDEESKRWDIIGSATGFKNFCTILKSYASNPKNEFLSEHDHLGPYMYLTITTWKHRDLDGSGIVGRLPDINFFAEMIDQKLSKAKSGDSFKIGHEYAKEVKFIMVFKIMEDKFDPSSLDPMEWANNIKP